MSPDSSAIDTNSAGPIRPRLGIPPAHHRLHTGDCARLERNLRLVVEHQLLPRERTAKTGLDRVTRDGARVHLGGEELAGVAPALLGLVHRRVRRLQQRRGLASVVRDRCSRRR